MLTKAWKPLRPHPIQSAVWRTRSRFVALACGRGSGKTELSRRRVVRFLPLIKSHGEEPMYFYALPTREQAHRVAWDKLKALVPSSWLAKRHAIHESDLTIKTEFGSTLHLVGMDKPQRIEGNQWDGGVLDESCDQKPGAFDRSVRPALSHRTGWCWRIGVPKRFGCGAADFRKCWLEWQKIGEGYEAYTWPSHDILTPEEIRDAAKGLAPKDFEEQYGAIWQGTSGLVFYAFDEELSLKRHDYDPMKRIYVGSDFNVDPMAWVLLQPSDKNQLTAFDMIWKRNTNTPDTLNALHAMYPQHPGGWMFIGDATGKARRTSATQSDYTHILNDHRFLHKRVHYPSSNPRRSERFASTNAAFKNALGERRLFVDPRRCQPLINDLISRAYVPGENDADDSGDDIGHATDALGYVIHVVWPVIPISDALQQISVGAA